MRDGGPSDRLRLPRCRPASKEPLMQWQEVSERYPAQWIVVEVLSFRTDADDQRYASEMDVVAAPSLDNRAAYLRCKQLRYRHVGREFYSVHTSWDTAWWTIHPLPMRRASEPG